MVEKLRNLKVDVTLSALLSVFIGVLLVLCPTQVTVIFARIIAVILMVSGGIFFVTKILEPAHNALGMIVGGLVILIGLWIFLSPTSVVQIVPMGIGVLLIVHGMQDLSMAVEIRKNHGERWWVTLLAAGLNVLFGVLCICNAFGLFKLMLMIVGLMLIYDGVSDMLIVHKVNRSAKNVVDSAIIREETIDDDDYGF